MRRSVIAILAVAAATVAGSACGSASQAGPAVKTHAQAATTIPRGQAIAQVLSSPAIHSHDAFVAKLMPWAAYDRLFDLHPAAAPPSVGVPHSHLPGDGGQSTGGVKPIIPGTAVWVVAVHGAMTTPDFATVMLPVGVWCIDGVTGQGIGVNMLFDPTFPPAGWDTAPDLGVG